MARVASVLYEGSRAICPRCAGLMGGAELRKKCIDCGAIWICTGEGIAENELEYTELRGEVAQSA